MCNISSYRVSGSYRFKKCSFCNVTWEINQYFFSSPPYFRSGFLERKEQGGSDIPMKEMLYFRKQRGMTKLRSWQ